MDVCGYVSEHTDATSTRCYGEGAKSSNSFGNFSSHQVHALMKDQIKLTTRISVIKKSFDIPDAESRLQQGEYLMPPNIYAMKSRFNRQVGTIKLSWNKAG